MGAAPWGTTCLGWLRTAVLLQPPFVGDHGWPAVTGWYLATRDSDRGTHVYQVLEDGSAGVDGTQLRAGLLELTDACGRRRPGRGLRLDSFGNRGPERVCILLRRPCSPLWHLVIISKPCLDRSELMVD